MQNAKKLLVGAAALLLAGAGCAQGGTQQAMVEVETGPIKLGFLGPLTGDAASLGQDALKATQLAVEEVNAAGGVNGRTVELVAEDAKCTPKEAATAGTKLIGVDKVSAIVGGLCSGETTAVAPAAEENKVVLFSPCSSAPTITTAGDYIFRSYPSDAYQGKVAADYVFTKLGKKKVATLAVLGDYGTGLKKSFEDNFKALGGEVVASEDYTQDSRDLRTQLAKIKSSGAELLYFTGYTEGYLTGLKQAKELGLTMPIVGGDTFQDKKVQESGLAEGVTFTVGAVSAKDEAWVQKLQAKGGNNTECAPRSYDNVKILVEAMKKVGSSGEKVKAELYNVKDYAGVGGPVSLDQNGDVVGAKYDIKVIKNKAAEDVK